MKIKNTSTYKIVKIIIIYGIKKCEVDNITRMKRSHENKK